MTNFSNPRKTRAAGSKRPRFAPFLPSKNAIPSPKPTDRVVAFQATFFDRSGNLCETPEILTAAAAAFERKLKTILPNRSNTPENRYVFQISALGLPMIFMLADFATSLPNVIRVPSFDHLGTNFLVTSMSLIPSEATHLRLRIEKLDGINALWSEDDSAPPPVVDKYVRETLNGYLLNWQLETAGSTRPDAPRCQVGASFRVLVPKDSVVERWADPLHLVSVLPESWQFICPACRHQGHQMADCPNVHPCTHCGLKTHPPSKCTEKGKKKTTMRNATQSVRIVTQRMDGSTPPASQSSAEESDQALALTRIESVPTPEPTFSMSASDTDYESADETVELPSRPHLRLSESEHTLSSRSAARPQLPKRHSAERITKLTTHMPQVQADTDTEEDSAPSSPETNWILVSPRSPRSKSARVLPSYSAVAPSAPLRRQSTRRSTKQRINYREDFSSDSSHNDS